MKRLRLTPLGSMITTVSLSIGVATSVIVYVWVVVIGGHEEAAQPILIGALIGFLLALGIGFYFAQLVATRVQRIEEAARKVADGDFAARIPVDSSGQLGQLARTFNEMQRRLAELDSARTQAKYASAPQCASSLARSCPSPLPTWERHNFAHVNEISNRFW